MNRILTAIAISLCFQPLAQNDSLIDHPILKLERYNYHEIDSVKGLRIEADIESVDWEDNAIPAIYSVQMEQFSPVKYHLFITRGCNSANFHSMSYRVPSTCQYWTKPDSNTTYFQPISKITEQGKLSTEAYRPDSVQKTNMACLAQFYQAENDSVRCDTLFEKEGTAFSFHKQNGIPYWQCSYYYELKHGKEIAHYHLDEVSGKSVNANTNLKKYEGEWKYGRKKGKWYFFDIYGDLDRIEFYRKGVCKKIMKTSN